MMDGTEEGGGGSRKNGSKLLARETDCLQRLNRKRNKAIKEMTEMVKDTTDEVQKRQLKWSEHTNRMDEAR
jgi:hypothetical protein